ncbi:potassium channel family protein [Cellulomonas hominis]|uniref:potassium channel family protein n=1 Tax=Cellulomonas hominis TaxID=156981 RepID=UPI001B911342|nr:potassium channel family protein [Cellulomonas hominis]VTR75746.1 hypothetical protein CHMI_00498 [Cellulomonas hominis]
MTAPPASTRPGPPALPPPRAEQARAVARTAATTLLLLLVYVARPVDRPTAAVLTLLVVGLVVLVAVLVWQVRTVIRSPYPMLRAVEAFVVAAVLFVTVFATGYAALSEAAPASFTEPLDKLGALYFTMTVLATVGFGDIAPVSGAARVVTTVQMVCGLAFLGVVGRLFLAAVQRSQRAGRPD